MNDSPRLTFVALSVSDLEISIDFYRSILGIPLQDESHDAELNDPWYGGAHAACSWTNGAFMHFAYYMKLNRSHLLTPTATSVTGTPVAKIAYAILAPLLSAT